MSSSQHACQFCSAYFKTSAALCYHYGDEHLFCNRCQTRFIITRVLEDHRYISPHHHPCHTCRRDFTTHKVLQEHWAKAPHHHYCSYCDEHFDEHEDLKNHYKQSHCLCDRCNLVVRNEIRLKEHYRRSSKHTRCVRCNEGFRDNDELNKHYKQSPSHFYCPDCKTHYLSKQNLNAHLKSSIHQPKTVACPLKNCQRTFTSKAALVLHFESGKCGSRINKAVVDDLVRKFDRNHIITDPSRMLTNGDTDRNSAHYATERSWNGYAYECYLCHGTFRSLPVLNNHLASPKHQNKMYICPGATCRTRFSTLSGLVQHIESERCGIIKFEAVQDTLNRAMKRITV